MTRNQKLRKEGETNLKTVVEERIVKKAKQLNLNDQELNEMYQRLFNELKKRIN